MQTTESPADSGEAGRIPGTRLGRYRMGAPIGRGGSACVHLGLEPALDGTQRKVAIKLVHDHLADEPQFVAMFLDEVSIAVKLAHPNIVRAYEMGEDAGKLFLVMEYLHGQPLNKLFVRGFRNGRKLPLDVVAYVGACVARGLHYAHNLTAQDGTALGLVHRDVSPRNVFVGYDGTVKLIDFGIAKAEGRLARTRLGYMKGTFSYIAPERAIGGDCDHRADLFSLGTVLFEAAVGQRLFRGDDDVETLSNVMQGKIPDPRSVRPDIPEELANILRRALAMLPKDRFSSGDELATALDEFVANSGEPAPQAQLAHLMEELFAAEREAQETAVAALQANEEPYCDDAGDDSAMAVASTSSGTLSAVAARAPRVARWAAIGAVALSTVAVVAYAAARWAVVERSAAAQAAAPRQRAPGVPQQVALRVEVLPPELDAHVEVAGVLVARPHAVSITRGKQPVVVRVRADGYEEAVVNVVPDENRVVTVVLRELLKSASTQREHSRGASQLSRSRISSRSEQPPNLGEMLNRRH